MKLIVGLGNPGKEHEDTRHNAGFLIIDKLVAVSGAAASFDKKANAEVAKTEVAKKRVLLAKPLTYMNSSGVATRALMDFYKLKPEDIIVVHDDKDIPLGETRIQTNRGPAGHNGVKSIIEHLGTKNFTRIRVGIAPEDQNKIKDTVNFVIGRFTSTEMKQLKKVIENVIKEIETLV
ncbi:MAG TPA: aminoacyl-tRNA hydrolase [Candidatus Udaeobacter sp.]|nr:aminoacyl-tRNA hydrolase [Candidatus Udaeobacter sp.]